MIKTYNRIKEIINDYDDIAIFSHVRPDGDSIGSSLAMDILLKKMGKNSKIFFRDNVPEVYQFLPEFNNVFGLDDFDSIDYDLIIVLDISEINRLGLNSSEFYGKKIICIDHHYTNEGFADINLINPQKAATCLIVFEMMNEVFKEFIDKNIAACLLTGIVSDTGGFRFRNTDSEVFKAVSEIIRQGVDYQDIMAKIYCSYPLRKYTLLKRVLKNSEMEKNFVYSYITEQDFKDTKACQEDTDGIVNQLMVYKPFELAFLVMQTGREHQKISIRSKKLDISKVARKFGGGGHKNASGFNMTGEINKNIDKILKVVREFLENE
ncbi:MAG: DHH family phosphoesterase [Candidatus Muiribacteriota bacterium]